MSEDHAIVIAIARTSVPLSSLLNLDLFTTALTYMPSFAYCPLICNEALCIYKNLRLNKRFKLKNLKRTLQRYDVAAISKSVNAEIKIRIKITEVKDPAVVA